MDEKWSAIDPVLRQKLMETMSEKRLKFEQWCCDTATKSRRSIARILRGYSATGLRIGREASLTCGVQRIGNFKNRVEYWCSSAFIRGPQDLVCVGSLDQTVPECTCHRFRS